MAESYIGTIVFALIGNKLLLKVLAPGHVILLIQLVQFEEICQTTHKLQVLSRLGTDVFCNTAGVSLSIPIGYTICVIV